MPPRGQPILVYRRSLSGPGAFPAAAGRADAGYRRSLSGPAAFPAAAGRTGAGRRRSPSGPAASLAVAGRTGAGRRRSHLARHRAGGLMAARRRRISPTAHAQVRPGSRSAGAGCQALAGREDAALPASGSATAACRQVAGPGHAGRPASPSEQVCRRRRVRARAGPRSRGSHRARLAQRAVPGWPDRACAQPSSAAARHVA